MTIAFRAILGAAGNGGGDEPDPPAGDFPVIEGTTSGQNNSESTSQGWSYPETVNAGDVLVVIARAARHSGVGLTSMTTPTGWTRAAYGGTGLAGVYWRVADGSESGSVGVTLNTAARFTWIMYRISGAASVEADITATSDSSYNPPSLTPSWGSAKTLWIAAGTSAGSNSTRLSAAPTNYDDLVRRPNSSSSTSTFYCTTAAAHRFLEAASEDPGEFTSANSYGTPFTIAVQPG